MTRVRIRRTHPRLLLKRLIFSEVECMGLFQPDLRIHLRLDLKMCSVLTEKNKGKINVNMS